MTFGKRLKKLRTDRGITQLQLSDILGTAKSNISKYESDTIEPNFTMLEQLSELFKVSVDYLLGFSNTSTIISVKSNLSTKILSERLGILLSEDSSLTEEFYSSTSKIPIDTFRRYITGEETPGAYEICKLIEAFNTSADYLFGNCDTPHPNGQYAIAPVGKFASNLSREIDGNYLETELADSLDVPISSIKELIAGNVMPDGNLLFKISQLIGKSTDYLLGIMEHSRRHDIDGNYPFFFDKEISARISKLMDSQGDCSYWADFLSISEEEILMFKNYGFLIHISVLNKLSEMLNVSIDYLSGRTDAQKTLMQSEEPLLLAFRNLNDENRSIAYGEVLKLKKDQEREEYLRSTPSVAAEDVRRGTGTDGLGK